MLYLLKKDDRPLFVNLDHVTAVGAHPHPTEATPYAVWIRKDPSCEPESYGIPMDQYLEIIHALDVVNPMAREPRTTPADTQLTTSAAPGDPKLCRNDETEAPEDVVNCPKSVRHVWEVHDIDL